MEPVTYVRFDIAPDPHAAGLTTSLRGVDASGQPVDLPVVTEKPLTIYLNRQEIVTAMTLGSPATDGRRFSI